LVLGWKDFNGTSDFYSLTQGERRIKRIPPQPDPLLLVERWDLQRERRDERKKLKTPSP